MIDHIILTVNNLERSIAFYNEALAPLGISMIMDFKGQDGHHDLKGFGDEKAIYFWIKAGQSKPSGVHIGFVAQNKEIVNEFYSLAVQAGAETMHSPRIFPEYYPGYYAAWIIDPDGYELEMVYKS